MEKDTFFRSKRLIVSSIVLTIMLFAGLGFAQDAASQLSYAPTAEEIAKYGPGFPAYCSAYESRPECIAIYGSEYGSQYGSQPIPVESDPCYLTGGYQEGCVPAQQYPCLPGDPSPNCLPQYAPTIIPVPVPMPIYIPPPPCPDIYNPNCNPPVLPPVLPPPPPPSVYDFRLETPVPIPSCQYGYSPHCLAIAPMKAFDHAYAISPAITSYRVGETLEYRINSQYSGYLYVFVIEADGSFKTLYPNAYSGDPMYVHVGTVVDLPGKNANYSLDVTAPYGIHRLISMVTTQPLPKHRVDSINHPLDLDNLLLELGLHHGIYHGYSETAFDVVY